jgi:hypothetical protein
MVGMNKRTELALLLATMALFLILNRAAYKGYFQDDDLETLGWAKTLPASELIRGLLSPQVPVHNFRPVGAFYYRVLGGCFGLDFPKFIATIHALHLLNIWLLWLLARRIGLSPLAAFAGAFFFGFHVALFDAWWKPMFVFDVLCGTFSLLTLLAYAHNRWILSLVSFWLAYKSKELAVMLPAVLACYEIWFGNRQWKRLLPFFAVSLLFGLQAVFNPTLSHAGTPYALIVGPSAQAKTFRFYTSSLFHLPYAGLLLLPLPFLFRDRRLWMGLATTCLLLVPLLLLPGRMFAVYWYVPLTGVAIMLATVADGRYRVAAALMLIWLPWDFVHFRETRPISERRERQNRAYVSSIERYARTNPGQRLFVLDVLPEEFQPWGVKGALACFYPGQSITLLHVDQPGSQEAIQGGDAAWLHWKPDAGRLDIIKYPKLREPLAYIQMDLKIPGAQLLSGWYPLEDHFRWTQPDATAVLLRPAGVHSFEVAACATPAQFRAGQTVKLRVALDGRVLGEHEFTGPGCQTLRWPAPGEPGGTSKVEFHVTPPFRPMQGDTRTLGISITGFGFVPD